jgi:hypothetical protein
MFILVPVILMVATTLALIVLRLARPQFRFSWLISLGATFLAWISVLVWRTQLPLSITITPWAPASLVASAPLLAVDQFSWLYALSLLTLTLAALLAETVREGFPDSATLAVNVGVCGLGLLAVTAGNPLTLALIWAALDLTELIAMLTSAGGRLGSQRVVTSPRWRRARACCCSPRRACDWASCLSTCHTWPPRRAAGALAPASAWYPPPPASSCSPVSRPQPSLRCLAC